MIIHIDLDAFFCAVEENLNPALRGMPFAVGGQPNQRGVVASCSYPARQYGVRSAMPMSRAVQLCPDLLIVPHKRKEYSEASHRVMTILHNITPLVEQISIDEAFIDVSGHPEAGYKLAASLQARINAELSLPVSLGVASNKLVAKIANNIGKASKKTDMPPNAIKIIPPGQEAAFLAPLPIEELWGVGPKTAEKLHQKGVYTIGDIAKIPERDLIRMFGKPGADLARHAQGIDKRKVETDQETKSISRETTFTRDTHDELYLKEVLRELSDGVGLHLRREKLMGRTVHIKLRWSDFTTLTRQTTFTQPINRDDEIYQAAIQLFNKHWIRGKAVRLIGVGISGFDNPARQLSLWDAPTTENEEKLQNALDDLKTRFGENAIQRGSIIKKKKPRAPSKPE